MFVPGLSAPAVSDLQFGTLNMDSASSVAGDPLVTESGDANQIESAAVDTAVQLLVAAAAGVPAVGAAADEDSAPLVLMAKVMSFASRVARLTRPDLDLVGTLPDLDLVGTRPLDPLLLLLVLVQEVLGAKDLVLLSVSNVLRELCDVMLSLRILSPLTLQMKSTLLKRSSLL